eukprot:TRINITY_DN9993_c0_g1_i1.p1 TRINITY_DN9993_c0_g1~~TRINITY_DN9993_c0_g1_i1.p1  ORF type:complete len:205 (-),score=66.74 TRINITY_DN9993_c0_g1_i1:309-923(-)
MELRGFSRKHKAEKVGEVKAELERLQKVSQEYGSRQERLSHALSMNSVHEFYHAGQPAARQVVMEHAVSRVSMPSLESFHELARAGLRVQATGQQEQLQRLSIAITSDQQATLGVGDRVVVRHRDQLTERRGEVMERETRPDEMGEHTFYYLIWFEGFKLPAWVHATSVHLAPDQASPGAAVEEGSVDDQGCEEAVMTNEDVGA